MSKASIILSLVVGAIVVPSVCSADELVRQSCSILIDSAKARGDKQAMDTLPHFTSQSEAASVLVWENYTTDNTIGGAQLSKSAEALKAMVGPQDVALAHNIKELRQRISDDGLAVSELDHKIGELNDRLGHARSDDQDSHRSCRDHDDHHGCHKPDHDGDHHRSARELEDDIKDLQAEKTEHAQERDQLTALMNKANQQLKGDLDPILAAFNWNIAGTASAYDRGFDADALVIRNCTERYDLSFGLTSVALCGDVDLASGQATYELRQQNIGSNGENSIFTSSKQIADLGTSTPYQVAHEYPAWASFKHQLRKAQIADMPEICKQIVSDRLDQIAEAEGVKITAPAATAVASSAPAPVGSQTPVR